MAYNFFDFNQVQYGIHSQLNSNSDLSIGVWIKLLAGVGTAGGQANQSAVMGCVSNFFGFTNIRIDVLRPVLFTNQALGYAVQASHIGGGSFQFGVICRPGEIHPTYAWGLNKWMYFGFTRDFSASKYLSYFGTRTLIVAGQTDIYSSAPPLSVPGGFNMGQFFIGHSSGGSGLEVGPMTLWSRKLTLSEHEFLAKCTMPPSVAGLQLKVGMDVGASDSSPNAWSNTFVGSPLPTYVVDTPCSPFGAGSDYSLSSP